MLPEQKVVPVVARGSLRALCMYLIPDEADRHVEVPIGERETKDIVDRTQVSEMRF